MTNAQSKVRSVIAAFLSLIVFAAIIVGVYLDVDHAIKNGNQAQLQQPYSTDRTDEFSRCDHCLPAGTIGETGH
jgi:hypothetical protein